MGVRDQQKLKLASTILYVHVTYTETLKSSNLLNTIKRNTIKGKMLTVHWALGPLLA